MPVEPACTTFWYTYLHDNSSTAFMLSLSKLLRASRAKTLDTCARGKQEIIVSDYRWWLVAKAWRKSGHTSDGARPLRPRPRVRCATTHWPPKAVEVLLGIVLPWSGRHVVLALARSKLPPKPVHAKLFDGSRSDGHISLVFTSCDRSEVLSQGTFCTHLG